MEISFESYKERLFTSLQAMDPDLKGAYKNDMDDVTDWEINRLDVDSAIALKNIFFYLGLVFRYPTEEIYSEVESHLSVFSGFFADYGGAVPQLPPLADLQSEYISLFVTNKGFLPAAPYASCYQGDGMLMGDAFYRLKQIMMESGFMMDASVKELEDHVAVLLEFCSSLLNTLVVKNNSSEINFQTCVYALMEISYQYIEPWIDVFFDKINSYATYDFYKVAANALKSLFHDADAIYIQLLGFRNISTNELQG